MGLLKLLGIEKYLKKVKTYVDEKANELDGRINSINPNAPTPDWSAEYGALGFIANKPISLIHNKRYNLQPEVACGVYDFNNVDNYVYVSVQGKVGFPEIPFFFNGCIDEWETKGDDLTHRISVKYGDYNNTVLVELNTRDKTVMVYDANIDGIGDLFVTISEYDGAVMAEEASSTLPDECIPDSIARKSDIPSTPVNETLMKYLANPYKIMAGTPIPEDLHNLIYDDAHGLNAVIMSVCRYYEMADSTNYAINAVEDNGIYVGGGSYYSYNYTDRVFE